MEPNACNSDHKLRANLYKRELLQVKKRKKPKIIVEKWVQDMNNSQKKVQMAL